MNDDIISREALKKAIDEAVCDFELSPTQANEIVQIIDNAPTVPLPDFKEGYKQAILDGKTNFSRPQGRWSFDSEFLMIGSPYGSYKCSNCGIHTDDKEDNFCWNCGADMRGENEKRE